MTPEKLTPEEMESLDKWIKIQRKISQEKEKEEECFDQVNPRVKIRSESLSNIIATFLVFGIVLGVFYGVFLKDRFVSANIFCISLFIIWFAVAKALKSFLMRQYRKKGQARLPA